MLVAIPTAMPERAVDQQVRELGRQDRRLLLGPVVVVDEVDGVLVDVGEHLAGDRGQARLGVAHRGGGVAVDRAEVALPVDERVAHREVLGQPDERVVQRAVAVRVVLAHHLADDRRALAVRAGGRQPHLAHRVQDPAVDRLEAVADVGQGARHDDAHRVVEVADPHLVLDADRSEVAQVVGHVSDLSCRVRRRAPGRRGGSRASRVAAASQRGLGMLARVGQPAEAGDRVGRRRGGWGAGVLADPGEPVAELVGGGRVELGQRVADDPRAVAVGGRGGAIGLVPKRRLGGRGDRRPSASDRPTRGPSGRPARRRR